MIAICLARIGGLGRDADGKPAQAQGDDICQVVGGVGQEGETVGENSRSGFHDDKGQGEEERPGETCCGLFCGFTQMGMGVRMGLRRHFKSFNEFSYPCSTCSRPNR